MSLLKKPIPAHAFLLAIYPILFLYAQNVDFVPLGEALVPMAITAAFAALLFLSLSAILKDVARAGLLVSLFAVLFFSYGHFAEALGGFGLTIGQFNLGPDVLLLPLWGLFFALGAYSLLKTRRNLRTLTNLLNVVATVLVLLSLGGIVSYHIGKRAWSGSASEEDLEISPADVEQIDNYPDIYYIILDAYASADVLGNIWGYDNHEFIDYLTEKGFYVVPEGHSNYACTFLSLASSLNMVYVNYLSDELGRDSTDRSIPYHMVQDSKVVRFLRAKGYKFVHFQTGWGPTARNIYADRDIRCGNVSEFSEVLVRTTVLRPLANQVISHDRRAVVLCTFDTLPQVQQMIEGPRFVFAHILVPHPPFLFGPDGESIVAEAGLRSRDWSKYYLGQLEFVTKKTEELVESILSESETPPIIILQADHGSKSIKEKGDPSPEMLQERMGILNAYHLPNNGEARLYDSVTPVNTFRLIFNIYFDANYELLEDSLYFSKLARPYDFLDATDTLRDR